MAGQVIERDLFAGCGSQEILSVLDTQALNEFGECLVAVFEELIEAAGRNAQSGGDFIYAEVGIGEVVGDITFDLMPSRSAGISMVGV
ncbi:hypothetical protein BKG85_08890 [Mycobacteroides chelonae]|nr:hypothetical protein [Mycobacteroides chelonae]OHU63624.1 hypothetical protein BKG85_08890 [Mycobacteroides chelonae]